MTVCIAAMYRQPDGVPGIVLATDWQATDTHTSFKSITLKAASLGSDHIAILGSGDIVYFGDIAERAGRLLAEKGEPITVQRAADAYLQCEIDWQNEYRERHVLAKYGLTLKSYVERMNEFPPEFVDRISNNLDAVHLPCSADVIVAGIDDPDTSPKARIIKYANGISESRNKDGFAIIGEGESVAVTEFGNAIYSKFWPPSATLFLCFLAKKRAQAIASVGEHTTLSFVTPNGGTKVVLTECKTRLDGVYTQLQKEIYERSEAAYTKAREITEEYYSPESGGYA